VAGCWFSQGPLVSSTSKTGCHDVEITEILMKIALKTIKPNQTIETKCVIIENCISYFEI
jgi:hypothetical protein